jgi:ketosteroid isomerase-like protein
MRMQQLVRLTLFWFCFLPLLAAQTKPPQPGSETGKIVALEAKWTEAYKLRQIDILSSLLAEDFVITVEDGSTVDVAQQSNLKVRLHGNTAIVTGAYHEKGSSKGKPYEYHDRFTDTWMKINGKWQVIASHYSIPATD